jgi:hypothetical protein
MSELKVRFWVDALRWRAESAGASVYIDRKGDPDAGIVILKTVNQDQEVQVFAPVRNFEGEREWICPLGEGAYTGSVAEEYIRNRIESDPDIWVIEIADKTGRHFLTEAIEKF